MKRAIMVAAILGVLLCAGVSCKSYFATSPPPQPTNQPASQPANPPANPPTSQPTNQPASQPSKMAGLPETLKLPTELAVPVDTPLREIVARYYKTLKLHDGTEILLAPESVPAIAARIAKYNNIADSTAKVPAGRVLKLPRMYVIRGGDTYYRIAKAVYGSGKRWKAIAAANPEYNPNKLEAGWALILP